MLRPSPNHGTQRLPNDDDDEYLIYNDLAQLETSRLRLLMIVNRVNTLIFFERP